MGWYHWFSINKVILLPFNKSGIFSVNPMSMLWLNRILFPGCIVNDPDSQINYCLVSDVCLFFFLFWATIWLVTLWFIFCIDMIERCSWRKICWYYSSIWFIFSLKRTFLLNMIIYKKNKPVKSFGEAFGQQPVKSLCVYLLYCMCLHMIYRLHMHVLSLTPNQPPK